MMTWLPVIIMQFCTFGHAGSPQEYRCFCARHLLENEYSTTRDETRRTQHPVYTPRRTEMTVTLQQQQLMDSFYALDNVITIKITMPQGEWDKVRNEEPKGGRCFWEWKGGSRYTWRKADSVEISGTKFPARTTF